VGIAHAAHQSVRNDGETILNGVLSGLQLFRRAQDEAIADARLSERLQGHEPPTEAARAAHVAEPRPAPEVQRGSGVDSTNDKARICWRRTNPINRTDRILLMPV
jgi:hypothetical protein